MLQHRHDRHARPRTHSASNREISPETGIAETTVQIHVQHVLRKLAVNTRVQAAVLA